MWAGEAEHSGNEKVTEITLRPVFVMKIDKIYGKVIQSNNMKQIRSISF